MSFDHPDLQISTEDAATMRIGIVTASYNRDLTDALLARVKAVLTEAGVPSDSIVAKRVPGSAEVPFSVNMLAMSGSFDAIVGLGVVLAGATDHHSVIADSTAIVLQQIGVQTETPTINGILTVETLQQAQERVIGNADRGKEFAMAALYMAVQKRQLKQAFEVSEVGNE